MQKTPPESAKTHRLDGRVRFFFRYANKLGIKLIPKCGSTSLEKLFSTFAAHGGGTSSDGFGADFGGGEGCDTGGDCGSCGDPRGPGSCAIN